MSNLRRAGRVLDRASPWIAIAVVVIGFVILQEQGATLRDQGHQIAEGSKNQIVNRAANVEAWCGGINGSRDYNRGFVKRVTGGRVAYTLSDLPCEELIRKTLESPKRKEPLTLQSNPITFQLLHKK